MGYCVAEKKGKGPNKGIKSKGPQKKKVSGIQRLKNLPKAEWGYITESRKKPTTKKD